MHRRRGCQSGKAREEIGDIRPQSATLTQESPPEEGIVERKSIAMLILQGELVKELLLVGVGVVFAEVVMAADEGLERELALIVEALFKALVLSLLALLRGLHHFGRPPSR